MKTTQTGRKLNIYLSSQTEDSRNVIPIKEQIEMIEYEQEYFSGSSCLRTYWISTNSYRTCTFSGGPHNMHLRLEIRDDGNNRGWTFSTISGKHFHRFSYSDPVIGNLRTLGQKVFYNDLADNNYLACLPYSGWNNTCIQLSGRVVQQE